MLIDGHSMAFRAFYALPADKFKTKSGQSTNAVYGFVSMLANLVEDERPDLLAVAFDVGRQTIRTERFPDYKAQRAASPPEFKGQVPLIKEVLESLGIITLEKPNYEADDIIATLATNATAKGLDTAIVTGDRDSFQLVNDHTTVLYPIKGVRNLHRFTPEAVEEKYGLTPVQYPDFAALRGDPSDNLPGVPKVGEKTAQKWITTYGSLDELIAHQDEIKGKVGESFRERVDQVLLNRELTEMVKNLSLPYQPEQLERQEVAPESVHNIFDLLEFGSNLRDRVNRIFFPPAMATAELDRGDIKHTSEDLADWLHTHQGKTLGFKINSNPQGQAALAIASEDGEVWAGLLADFLPADEKALEAWLHADTPKISHEVKNGLHLLSAHGFEDVRMSDDVSVAAYLIQPGIDTTDIYSLYERICERPMRTGNEISGWEYPREAKKSRKKDDPGEDQITINHRLLGETMATAVAVFELQESILQRMQDTGGYGLYRDMEMPLVEVVFRMEQAGIAVDTGVLEDLLEQLQDKLETAQAKAREIAGDPELNLSSPKQLQVVLFETLQLPKTRKIKTGYSTAAKEIEALAAKHPTPFLDYLLEHREVQKLKSTIEGLLKAVADDGRIHTTFQQTVTSTGRFSSTDPNLQNIPVRSETGRHIRSAFVVGQDYECLLTADYSQIEMRVMADASGDEGLIAAYRNNEDLHNYVGSQVFDVPIDQVTPELRRKVKALSYGLAYGLSTFGLSQQLNIPPSEAKEIQDNYFKRFGGVRRYLHELEAKARQDGYTATLFGRRRYISELDSENRVARENAERAALNAPIQGTAADIIKIAMLCVDKAYKQAGLRSRVLLQVHDELVVEVAPGELEQARMLLETEMDQAVSLTVPLEVSSGVGANWDAAAH
ncbi:MAG: DNA polymerase I [Corynebacterium sp.]|nr:DNA polymerase I [Corynebacterium sp.]